MTGRQLAQRAIPALAVLGQQQIAHYKRENNTTLKLHNLVKPKIRIVSCEGAPKYTLTKLIQESKYFAADIDFLNEILGINRIEAANSQADFFIQTLSRDLGTTLKTKTILLNQNSKKLLAESILEDISVATQSDPVKPSAFQVAVTFLGAKSLMSYRVANALYKEGHREEALQVAASAQGSYHSYIHPTASLEAGIFIDHGLDVNIGAKVKINHGAYILHGVHIGDHTTIGKNSFIGANATIDKGLVIGDNVTIAAGTHVTSDIADNKTIFGYFNTVGSHKIVPSRLDIAHDDKSVKPNIKVNRFSDVINDLIPYNPNSPLISERLEYFKARVMHIRPKDQAVENPIMLAHFIANTALSQSETELYPKRKNGYNNFSLWLQGRIATVFKADIHPAAKMGNNLSLPYPLKKGLVIGATAVIGNNVKIGDGVTLGAINTQGADRHPKIGDNCVIGDNAIILGAGKLGEGSIVLPGTVLFLPAGTQTEDGRVWAGRPAIDVTKKYYKN